MESKKKNASGIEVGTVEVEEGKMLMSEEGIGFELLYDGYKIMISETFKK